LDAETVFRAFGSFHGETRPGPTIDGTYLLEDAADAFLGNRQHDLDYLCGFNKGEIAGTPAGGVMPADLADFEEKMKARYGDDAKELLALCNAQTADDLARLYNEEEVFHNRALGTRLWQIAQKKTGRKTWLYRFDVPIPGEDNPGSFHGAELWFVFNSLGRCWRPFTGLHYDRARQISGYWVNFVKTGDPNGLDAAGEPLPRWEISGEIMHYQKLEGEITSAIYVPDEKMKIAARHCLGDMFEE